MSVFVIVGIAGVEVVVVVAGAAGAVSPLVAEEEGVLLEPVEEELTPVLNPVLGVEDGVETSPVAVLTDTNDELELDEEIVCDPLEEDTVADPDVAETPTSPVVVFEVNATEAEELEVVTTTPEGKVTFASPLTEATEEPSGAV